jgi:hypothetical protein
MNFHDKKRKTGHMPSPNLAMGSNAIWLTLPSTPEPLLIRTYLLGLGADHSLLCALPENQILDFLTSGTPCKGRSCIDGETFEFETIIQQILPLPPAIRLAAPRNISRQAPRSFPRLTVNLTGVVRPLNHKGQTLAVLPVRLINLSPTGCQFSVAASAWPIVSSLQVHLSCRLPEFHHYSKFLGSVEWVHPVQELMIGLKFLFASPQEAPFQDVRQWYTSQKAHFVDTTA